MAKNIYIVSTQSGEIKDILRELDPDWELIAFTTPAEAIDAVRKAPPNLVLADQKMSGMSGSEMLDAIRQIAPQTVRMIVSTHAIYAEKIGSAHQYLLKPFNPRDLENRIRQALDAQESLKNPELGRLVTSLQSFPALPAVYSELLRELERENMAFDRTVDLLNKDGGVLTRLIQLANSPLFRGTTIITESKDALIRLGTSNVKALLLSMHVFQSYDKIRFSEMSVENIWLQSWKTARLAQKLCWKRLGEHDADDAFFAGLVYDLGCLILMENFNSRYREVCHIAERERRPLYQVEKDKFGVTHAELSGFMLRLWGVSKPVVDAVIFYNEPWESPQPEEFTPTVALYMAHILSRKEKAPDRYVTPELNQAYLNSVGAPNPAELLEQQD